MSDQTQQPSADAQQPLEPVAPDMSTPIGKALIAFQRALDSAVTSASADTDAQYATTLAAFDAMPAGLPGIAEARSNIEIARDAARKNARESAAYAIRQTYSQAFALIAAYGVPAATHPVRSNGRTAAQPAEPLTDASGAQYVKRGESRDKYVVTGRIACGECAVSEALSKTYGAPGNLRQAVFRALKKMSTADVAAHAACFDAFRDTETTFPVTVNVTYYDLVK